MNKQIKCCPKCYSDNVKMIMSSSGWSIYIQCQKCKIKREYRHYKDYKNRIQELKERAIKDWNTRKEVINYE